MTLEIKESLVNIQDLITEVKNDNKQIEEQAFKMYCKHTVKIALERYETDKTRAAKSLKVLEGLTEIELKESFNSISSVSSSERKEWLKQATENLMPV